MSAYSSPLPAVDRDCPDAAFVKAVRERYPTEREMDWAFTRRTDHRAQGPFKAPSLDDLVGYLHKLLRENCGECAPRGSNAAILARGCGPLDCGGSSRCDHSGNTCGLRMQSPQSRRSTLDTCRGERDRRGRERVSTHTGL